MTRFSFRNPFLPVILLLSGVPPLLDAASLEDLTYTANNAQITVTKCNSLAEGSLEIPALIEGFPVTAIGDNCFLDCSLITSVVLPAGVTSIGSSAFADSGLQSINFPDSLKQIGENAFTGTHLTHLTIPDLDYLGFRAFKGCYDLLSVKMQGTGPFLASEVFRDCFNLSEVTLSDDLMFIGNGAFADCLALKTITIPFGVYSVGGGAFKNCGLRRVKMLGGRDIESEAFAGNFELAEFEFPMSVDRIGARAFDGCPFTTLVFPGGPTAIGDRAFNTYSGSDARRNPLTRIYFLNASHAPLAEGKPFGIAVNPDAVVYCRYGSDFKRPRWAGIMTEIIKPEIRLEGSNGKVFRTSSTAVHEFKERKTGSSGPPLAITVSNVGNYPFKFLGAKITNDGVRSFSMMKVPKTVLEPGESVVLKIRFSPKRTGRQYANLKIAYTVLNNLGYEGLEYETEFSISMAGTGTK